MSESSNQKEVVNINMITGCVCIYIYICIFKFAYKKYRYMFIHLRYKCIPLQYTRIYIYIHTVSRYMYIVHTVSIYTYPDNLCIYLRFASDVWKK